MQPNYYEIFGLSPQATPDEVKKRYRSLARQYHPDVNPSQEAAQKIKLINEAYHVLGDVDRRGVYDAERVLRQQSRPAPTSAPTPPSANASSRPSTTPSRPYKPTVGEPTMEFNGFGRTPTSSPTTRAKQQARPTAQRDSDAFGTADRLLKEAQLAYVSKNLKEAENLCHQVLLIDRTSGTAHEILGDIYARRGMYDRASAYYSYAIQFNPRNVSVQSKLERLMGDRPASAHRGPTSTHQSTASPWERFADSPNRDSLLNVVSLVTTFGVLLTLVLLYIFPGQPFQSAIPWLSDISLNLLLALLWCGAMAGVLLALNGGMRPLQEEMFSRGTLRGDQNSPVSMGVVLTGFSFVWFYASLLVYIGFASARNRISPSVLRVYGLTLLLIVSFAILYQPEHASQSHLQTAAFAGNFLFPAMLFGWALGDVLRLRDR